MVNVTTTPVAYSVPFDNSSNGFAAQETQTAIEEAKNTSQGFPRAGISFTSNGVVSNGSWMGPTELLPNTPCVIFPVKTQINEITWANQNTNVAFRIQFRSGSKTGAIFYTLTVTSPNVGNGYVDGLTLQFNPGNSVYAQYLDDGNNLNDAIVTLWISRIP